MIAAITLCLIVAFPTLFFPAVTATLPTAQDGASPNISFRRQVSPAVLAMITSRHAIFFTNEIGAQGRLPEDVQEAPIIWYWRYVWALCHVKNNFSPYKLNWYYWIWGDWNTPELDKNYMGDCHFYVEYGAEYYGDYGGYVEMPEAKTINDQWKKGMKFNNGPDDLTQPYYWVVQPTAWDCSKVDENSPYYLSEYICRGLDPGLFSPCPDDLAGKYYSTTGFFNTTIGSTPDGRWRCGVRMELLTSAGTDVTVLSPKPSVSHSLTPKTNPWQIPETPYELRIDMKGFGIKSPALTKQSSWKRTYWWLEGNGYQAQENTGMWVDHIDPYYYQYWWSGPYNPGNVPGWCVTEYGLGCYGGAQWYVHNTYNNWWRVGPDSDLYFWPPVTPKALFPPSSVTLKYIRSNAQGILYDYGVEIGYANKGISFITAHDISFSGNPTNVRVSHPGDNVQWDLDLLGSYPDAGYD